MINPEIDLALLALFKTQKIYNNYISLVDIMSLSDEAQLILENYKDYYHIYNKDIELSEFTPWFLNKNGAMASELQTQYKHIFSMLMVLTKEPVDEVLTSLRYRKCGLSICKIMGLEKLILENTASLTRFDSQKLEELLRLFNRTVLNPFQEYHQNIALAFAGGSGNVIPTSLNCLNRIIGGFADKCFNLIVAGTNGGKTAFCVDQAMEAIKTVDGIICYFTNEQSDEIIFRRMVSNTLNKNQIDFPKFKDYMDKNAIECQKKYDAYTQGKIKLFYISGKTIDDVKRICDFYKPKMIVLDQVDNMLTAKQSAGHRPYYGLYSGIRAELANTYCTVLGTTQAKEAGTYWDNDEHKRKYKENINSFDVCWTSYDKQGHTDLILGLGVRNSDQTIRHGCIDRHKENLIGDFDCRLLINSSHFEDL